MTTEYTRDEVAQHNKKGDIWIVIHRKVFNVSQFIFEVGIYCLYISYISRLRSTCTHLCWCVGSSFSSMHYVVWISFPRYYLINELLLSRESWLKIQHFDPTYSTSLKSFCFRKIALFPQIFFPPHDNMILNKGDSVPRFIISTSKTTECI